MLRPTGTELLFGAAIVAIVVSGTLQAGPFELRDAVGLTAVFLVVAVVLRLHARRGCSEGD